MEYNIRGTGGRCGDKEKRINNHRGRGGKSYVKNRLGRPRRRWDRNNKIDRGQTEWNSVDQIHVSLDWGKMHASVKAVMKLPGFTKHRKFLSYESASHQITASKHFITVDYMCLLSASVYCSLCRVQLRCTWSELNWCSHKRYITGGSHLLILTICFPLMWNHPMK